jgi:hypothetical protein
MRAAAAETAGGQRSNSAGNGHLAFICEIPDETRLAQIKHETARNYQKLIHWINRHIHCLKTLHCQTRNPTKIRAEANRLKG